MFDSMPKRFSLAKSKTLHNVIDKTIVYGIKLGSVTNCLKTKEMQLQDRLKQYHYQGNQIIQLYSFWGFRFFTDVSTKFKKGTKTKTRPLKGGKSQPKKADRP